MTDHFGSPQDEPGIVRPDHEVTLRVSHERWPRWERFRDSEVELIGIDLSLEDAIEIAMMRSQNCRRDHRQPGWSRRRREL